MDIHAIVDDVEQFAEKAHAELKSMLAAHRETIDDDLAAAVQAAAPLPPWARTMVATMVRGLADSLMKQADGEDKAAMVPAAMGILETSDGSQVGSGSAPPAAADDADASPSEAQPVSDS